MYILLIITLINTLSTVYTDEMTAFHLRRLTSEHYYFNPAIGYIPTSQLIQLYLQTCTWTDIHNIESYTECTLHGMMNTSTIAISFAAEELNCKLCMGTIELNLDIPPTNSPMVVPSQLQRFIDRGMRKYFKIILF